MKHKIVQFLKKKKPGVASFLRILPFSYALLRIPKKRIMLKDTRAYFSTHTGEGDFYLSRNAGIIGIVSAVYLNAPAAGTSTHYAPDNFFIRLLRARYYHPFSSVISKEGYQIALVSNNQVNTQKEHTLFQELYLPKPFKSKDIGFVLSTSDDNNYYHCLFQMAPKIWTLEAYEYDISTINHFFLERSALPFQQELLAALNIGTEKIVDLGKHKHVESEKLLLVPEFEKPEPWICARIRTLFLNNISLEVPKNKKIYLSRSRARFRKLLNEPAFLECIARFNFQPVYTEGMSIAQQAALFHEADTIIAPHGAGLANIVFCRPSTIIIELRAKSHTGELSTIYEHLSGISNFHHYTYICAEHVNSYGPRAIYLDLSVDIPEFEKLYIALAESHPVRTNALKATAG